MASNLAVLHSVFSFAGPGLDLLLFTPAGEAIEPWSGRKIDSGSLGSSQSSRAVLELCAVPCAIQQGLPALNCCLY